ncbi:MAG: chromosome segregation protein SMC [Verrucomicrobia bacterium]|nr:chromosome segregation protein SMC [Verrucomicrobiota bacterium]
MHLKNLTAYGFKSFPDKTALNFLPGITAIVGPNGCGKSNVADAIRWVLGEQSAKALRGGEMADVIFNGTDRRPPMGLAEVSLTIGGVDENCLRAAGVDLTFDEVTVTRRVCRDGSSEYFINKTPCRLKDIQQLFMGTGMGRASYSIMAQGNITQLLSSKPEDRRLVFEEAAGITRFKAQKREALRKLESTEQNLLRVTDLIREVKRQIISLQRQAGKARRYQQYQAELRHLDTQLARHQFDQLQAEIHERLGAVEKLRSEIEGVTAQVVTREDELSQLRARLAEAEHEINQSEQRELQIQSEIERQASRAQFNEERLREFGDQRTRALTDITQAAERQQVTEQELAGLTARLDESVAKLEARRAGLQSRLEALREVEAQLRAQQEALREAQSSLFGAAQQLARVRNEINALDLQKQGNQIRLEKLSAEKAQLEEERARVELRLAEFARDTEAEQQAVQARRLSVEERQGRLRELQQEIAQVQQELDGLQRRQAETQSRLGVLQQLDASHEGFSAGALAAMRQSAAVIGSLADFIRVPDPYVVAIENALGHNLQLVLTEKPESAQQILADLAANKQGRASIAALAIESPEARQLSFPGDMAPQTDEAPARSSGDGPMPGELRALEVIEADPCVDRLLAGLLGRTWIVPDLAAATASIQNGHAGCDFVTIKGDLLNRHGVYTGGYLNGNSSSRAPSSILGRKNEIAELEQRLAGLRDQVTALSQRKGALQSEQTALQAGLQEAQTELRAQEVAIATRQGEFNALQNALRVLHQKIDTVVYEVQSLAALEREGEAKRATLAVRLSECETQETALQQRVNELNAGIEQMRQQRDAANAEVTEARVALATEEQLCASFRAQQGPLEHRLRELTQLAAQRRTEIAGLDQRQQQAESEIAEARQRMESLTHERDQQGVRTQQLAAQRDSVGSEVAAREEELRGDRRQLSMLQEQRSAVEVELAQKQMAVQNLRERIQQKYNVNLDDVRSESIKVTFADEGPAKVEVVTAEEMAAAGLSTDWDAVAAQVAALQKRIDEIGPVNLVAIQEYEETEQRHKFLSDQHDDLVKAKEQLVEVINRVNTQTKELFTTTFQQIRENFRSLFAEIFGGGSADLYLVDEGDVLESGIEIVARPPGKQLRSISLLSGGEQTMTAVALLFAIYQVKPSPFCVLDELDAPLDESNINRFIRILQRFLAHSQFIVITHNKRTIAMADVLYGVTMQEQGVSKIVSVKFHKTGDATADQPARPLETPAGVPPVDEEEDRPAPRDETLEVSVAS